MSFLTVNCASVYSQGRLPACYIRPDTCYGNSMQMDSLLLRPDYTSQSGLALYNGTPYKYPTAILPFPPVAHHTVLIPELK